MWCRSVGGFEASLNLKLVKRSQLRKLGWLGLIPDPATSDNIYINLFLVSKGGVLFESNGPGGGVGRFSASIAPPS